MLNGFKQFVLRGNVVDLAVGVVIGAAFGAVVTAFTKDLLTPLIAALVGKPDFSFIGFTINGTACTIRELRRLRSSSPAFIAFPGTMSIRLTASRSRPRLTASRSSKRSSTRSLPTSAMSDVVSIAYFVRNSLA